MTVERPLRKMLFLFREGVVLVTIFLILSCQYGTGAGQDIALVRTKPDVQQLPCPQQRVEFQCQIMVPSTGLTWTLPDGATLEFDGTSAVGDGANSSDNVYNATLTGKTEDGNIDSFFFTSTLLVLEPVNGSNLTCSGATEANTVQNATTVIISGIPNPPASLRYNDEVVIVSSVSLRWTRPSYTGGVPLANYTISANELTTVVPADNFFGYYNTPGLVYGLVNVSAINLCGLESQPAHIIIPIGSQGIRSVIVHLRKCAEHDDSSRLVEISWMYSPAPKGAVPAGEIQIEVELNPGNIICQVNALVNGCEAIIPSEGSYSVNITRIVILKDGHYSVSNYQTYDLQSLVVVAEQLEQRDSPYLRVNLRVNRYCTNTNYTVLVGFGTRPEPGEVCMVTVNSTAAILPPDKFASFQVDSTSLPSLVANETYCYTLYSFVTPESPSPEDPSPEDPSGSVVALSNTLLMILLVAVALG